MGTKNDNKINDLNIKFLQFVDKCVDMPSH
jgi:hypothetical protein